MSSAAYGNWGTPNLRDKDNKHDINLLAGAFVYARTGDDALRLKVSEENTG
jgi:putative heme degradation protein